MPATTFHCINCGGDYSGRTNDQAVAKFYTSPRHTCVARWYPLVDPPGQYAGKVGSKR